MAALLSSPMGPPARFDIFEQPSSPKYPHQDDLPPDFDKSFGSSMSISSSFDGPPSHSLRFPASSQQACFNPSFGFHSHMPSMSSQPFFLMSREAERISPRRGQGLGAAMGTSLNARSPGLGAKLSSPKDMDISPPSNPVRSPTDILPGLLQSVYVGSKDSGFARRITEPTGSLGRLFGTELSLNQARADQLVSSPVNEPPCKRRPTLISAKQTDANQAAVFGRLATLKQGALPTASRSRPTLMKSFTTNTRVEQDTSFSRSLVPRHRLSDSSLASASTAPKPRSRRASSESLFDEQEQPLDTDRRTLLHDTIVEYPSPSPSMQGGMANYFYDPQSPQQAGLVSKVSPNLMASLSSSPPASSPSNRIPPPRRSSLAPRIFEKTHTTTCVPMVSSLAPAATLTASSKTFLGKRSNPYSKRPLLGGETRVRKSTYPVLGLPSTLTAATSSNVTRPTLPAPRRCHSSVDNSSFLSGVSMHGMGSMAEMAPSSPERKPTALRSYSEMADANGSPIAPSSRSRHRPSILRRESKGDSSPLGYGTGLKRSGSRSGDSMADDFGLDQAPIVASPFSAQGMPGFGASEREGKVLPCFTVKEDGLMRISSHTLTDLLNGKYDSKLQSYHVIDCRFGYEYEGGHVRGAINLSTVDKVKNHFLCPGQGLHANRKPLPPRSQSGKPDAVGNFQKQVLVFHCEFSCKRAPSMALALRQADRALAHDYPNCHFPEIYILQGGYCEYFRTYSSICQPPQYVCMDDPRYQDRRSTELNGFRKQFARHRSFTYGETKTSSAMGTHCRGPSIREEDSSLIEESPCAAGATRSHHTMEGGLNAADTSFGSVGDSSFEGGIGDSPCAAAGSRRTSTFLKPGLANLIPPSARSGFLGRRTLQRAGTTGTTQFAR